MLIVPEDHHLYTSSPATKEICQHFFEEYKIKNFHYYRVYKSNHFFGLMTFPEAVRHHIAKRYLWFPHLTGGIKQDKLFYLLTPDLDNGFSQPTADYRNLFNLYNPFYYYENHQDYIEITIFEYSGRPADAFNYYLANIESMEKFKSTFVSEAAEIINKAEKNKIYIPENLRSNMHECFVSNNKKNNIPELWQQLTPRENQCIELLLKGLTAKNIANHLNISYRTVESHIENTKSKLGCHTKFELIKKLSIC